jgi:hypothetical protein
MKKLTPRYKRWQLYRARRVLRRKQGQAAKVRQAAIDQTDAENELLARRWVRRVSGQHRRTEIDAPAELSLSGNHDNVVEFFDDLREAVFIYRRSTALNFKTIEDIRPGAALVLAAEIDRWRRIRRRRMHAVDIEEWDPLVRLLLEEMGFFELLHVPMPERASMFGPGSQHRFIKFETSNLSDGDMAALLQRALAKVAIGFQENRLLYEGLTEAMTNAIHHAYPDQHDFRYPVLRRQWWMSGAVDHKTSRVGITFFDQGVGIPQTLPKYRFWEKVRSWLDARKLPVNHEGAMIAAAMEVSRTATGEPGRGRGLGNIRKFAETQPNGYLRILSGRGEYLYDKETGAERSVQQGRDLGGTLIQWEAKV